MKRNKDDINIYVVKHTKSFIDKLIEKSEYHEFAFRLGVYDRLSGRYNAIMKEKSGSVRDVYHYGYFGKKVFKEL